MNFKPATYEQAVEYWLRQQQAHWLHTEISMASDINDWKMRLTDAEKSVVGNILKGFAQTEVIVNDYWSRRVSKWFPVPEIVAMSTAFGSMETVHAEAYAYLNESLGLTDYTGFLAEPTTKAKLDKLIETQGTNRESIATSLAVFSGFAEGVQLFSSFAALMNFSRFNRLKGVGQIVAFSVRDESLHSEAGCWLFRQLCEENKGLHEAVYSNVRRAAVECIKLEDNFIDKCFEAGDIEGLSAADLKAFIRFRANTKLGDLGYKGYFKVVDSAAMDWFDYMTAGLEHNDFFSGRTTAYSKGVVDFNGIFD